MENIIDVEKRGIRKGEREEGEGKRTVAISRGQELT